MARFTSPRKIPRIALTGKGGNASIPIHVSSDLSNQPQSVSFDISGVTESGLISNASVYYSPPENRIDVQRKWHFRTQFQDGKPLSRQLLSDRQRKVEPYRRHLLYHNIFGNHRFAKLPFSPHRRSDSRGSFGIRYCRFFGGHSAEKAEEITTPKKMTKGPPPLAFCVVFVAALS